MSYNWRNKLILIVEDDILSSKYLEAILEETGVRTMIVQNGNDAMEIIKENPIDLVLMDIQLPGISGNETTIKIKEYNNQIPVIAQTAHAMKEDLKKSMNAGCDDYVTKPINSEVLLKKIENHINR
jgi:CheY-like chemotaxis protein